MRWRSAAGLGFVLAGALPSFGLCRNVAAEVARSGEVATAHGTVVWTYDAAKDEFPLSVKQHRLGALTDIQEIRSVGVFELNDVSAVLLQQRGPLTCQYQYVFVTLGAKGSELTPAFGSCGLGGAVRDGDSVRVVTPGDCPHIVDEEESAACKSAATATFFFKDGRVERADP